MATPLLTSEQHEKNHAAVRRFVGIVRVASDDVTESDMAAFVAAVRAVILETPPEIIVQMIGGDPRAIHDQRLADTVEPTVDAAGNALDPNAPPRGLLDGLKPGENPQAPETPAPELKL